MNITEFVIDLVAKYNAIIRFSASHFNLTFSQALLILSIPFDGISMTKLARKLGLDNSTLTRNVQGLKQLNIVTHKSDSYDKRVQLIILTNEGSNLYNSLFDHFNELNLSILSKLNLDDNELLHHSIEKLIWALECHRDSI